VVRGFTTKAQRTQRYEGRMTEYEVEYDPVVGVAAIRRTTRSALIFSVVGTICLLVVILTEFLPWPDGQFGLLQFGAFIAWLVAFASVIVLTIHSWLTVYGWGLTWRKPEMKEARKLLAASLAISLFQVLSLVGICAWVLYLFSTIDLSNLG
jgi:hypothetical protein